MMGRSHNFCQNLIRTTATARDVYDASNTSSPEDDFSGLFLRDMIIARRRVARRKLARLEMCRNQRKFVLRGIQDRMDKEEHQTNMMKLVELSIGYAAAGLVDVHKRMNNHDIIVCPLDQL